MNKEELIYKIGQKLYENEEIYKNYPEAVDAIFKKLIKEIEELLK